MKRSTCILSALLPALLLAAASLPTQSAALPSDPLTQSTRLPAPGPHWAWVNDVVFPHMADGQALLVDGDSGKFLGMLSTGFGFNGVVLPRDGKVIYSPELYFARGTRGQRTDVVTLYDPHTLSPLEEIAIPSKRSTNMPRISNAQLTDDDRFLLIYNFNPSQSLTVVDTRSKKFVGEIEIPGCALAFVTGNRSFFSLCADGSLLDVRMDDTGHAASQQRTRPLLDVKTDVVTDKGVRAGNTWLFVSKGGVVWPVESTAKGLQLGTRWALVSEAERAQNWRPGGLQPTAVNAQVQRFYAVMHQGSVDTYKDSGKEVWAFDIARKARVQRISLANPSSAIQVTRDAKPLLFSVLIEGSTTDVYDALTGQHLHAVESIGTTPTIIVTP
jgi:methylamine dehydrogenase heavy chain